MLAEGEVLKQTVLDRKAGGVLLYGEGARDLITAAVTVEKTGVGQRVILTSSEALPEDLRDGLLALWSGLEAGGVELLQTLEA